MSQDSAIRDRALSYLKAGASQEQTAKALGVEPSTISYLLSTDTALADEVQTADLMRRQAHNKHDDLAMEVELMLLQNLKEAAAGMYKPAEIAKAYQIVNGGKRRGTSAPSGVTHNNQQVIQLNLPPAIMKQIVMDTRSQIVTAGEQNLITMQSGNMKKVAAVHALATDIAGEAYHAAKNTRDIATDVHVTRGPQSDSRTETTINGLTAAEQAVRRIDARPVARADITAEGLGFDSL